MTEERDNLQKIFDKYDYEIIDTTDKMQLIKFGNECRDALKVKIE